MLSDPHDLLQPLFLHLLSLNLVLTFLMASGSPAPCWEEGEVLPRKQAVLTVLLHFLETFKGILQEDESAGKVIKVCRGQGRVLALLPQTHLWEGHGACSPDQPGPVSVLHWS